MGRYVEPIDIGMAGGSPSGHFNPFRLTDDPSVARILYEIRKEPKVVPEISKETNLNESYVRAKLEESREVGIVREEDGRYITNFILLDREEKRQVRELAKEIAVKEFGILKQELPGFKAKFERYSFRAQGYNWERMSYILVGAHLTDMAVMERGFHKYGIPSCLLAPERPGGGRYWLMGVEGGMMDYEFANHMRWDADCGWGCFFCRRKELRPKLTGLSELQWNLVRSLILEGPKTIRALMDISGGVPELVRDGEGKLLEAGCLLKTGEIVSVYFPIFNSEDLELVVSASDEIGFRIVEEVYVPSLERVSELFYTLRQDLVSEYGGFVSRLAAWAREMCLSELVRESLLPVLPSPVVQCYWGWRGKAKFKETRG